ncbi:MAG: DUF4920 domain-containing protein [Balneolaceae bacterium]
MKNILFLSLFIFSSIIVYGQTSSEVIRLSEPIQQTDEVEVFGSKIELNTLSPFSLIEVIEGDNESSIVTLRTSVSEVCNKKGCFFIAQEGDYSARITFKDYSFFIPTDSQGKEVTLVGEFTVQTLSEEQAKHYAEDAGKDPALINGDQKEYSIVATSVVVPKSK